MPEVGAVALARLVQSAVVLVMSPSDTLMPVESVSVAVLEPLATVEPELLPAKIVTESMPELLLVLPILMAVMPVLAFWAVPILTVFV